MPTPKRPTADRKPATKDTVKDSRATVSGPAESSPGAPADDLAAKVTGTNELAAQMPFNANKPSEYDPTAALAPPEGQSFKPDDPLVGASTVTELHGSEKTGSGGA